MQFAYKCSNTAEATLYESYQCEENSFISQHHNINEHPQMCYCFNNCSALIPDSEIQRSSETLMLRGRRCSGDGEVKSRARTRYPGDPVTLTCIWLRSTAARRIMAFARLWNSLPICRDFSKVVLLWSTSLAYKIYKHSFQFTDETQVSMQNLHQSLFLEQSLVLGKRAIWHVLIKVKCLVTKQEKSGL